MYVCSSASTFVSSDGDHLCIRQPNCFRSDWRWESPWNYVLYRVPISHHGRISNSDPIWREPGMIFKWNVAPPTPRARNQTHNSDGLYGQIDFGHTDDFRLRGGMRHGDTFFQFCCTRYACRVEEVASVVSLVADRRMRDSGRVSMSSKDAGPALRCYMNPSDMERLMLCSKILGNVPMEAGCKAFHNRIRGTVTDRMYNLPASIRGGVESDSLGPMRGFMVAGVLYGGLHLLAWNAPFASDTEQKLWRISGAMIASSGPALAVVGMLIGFLVNPLKPGPDSWFWGPIENVGIGLVWSFGPLFSALYTFCRFYLVVEVFLQLERLPQSAYEQPPWSPYFPHIN